MVTLDKKIQFDMDLEDTKRLEGLPWDFPLAEWPDHGVIPLSIRRGESRHPVIFVECDNLRYAIKETTPSTAEREIRNLREIERRGIPALSPVGYVTVPAAPILIEATRPWQRTAIYERRPGVYSDATGTASYPTGFALSYPFFEKKQTSYLVGSRYFTRRITRTWRLLGRPFAGKYSHSH